MRNKMLVMLLLAAPLVLASSAYADLISIAYQEPTFNSGLKTLVGSGPGAVSVGPIVYGTFTVNQTSAQDFADLGSPGLLNSQTLDISTTKAGTLTIWITAQGLSATGALNFLSSFAVNSLSGSIVSAMETTYFSTTNALYTGTVLDSHTFATIGSLGPLSMLGSPGSLYSVTEQYTIFDVGGATGNDNLTIDLSAPVPEPASLGLLGVGLLGIALKLRR